MLRPVVFANSSPTPLARLLLPVVFENSAWVPLATLRDPELVDLVDEGRIEPDDGQSGPGHMSGRDPLRREHGDTGDCADVVLDG